MNRFSSRTAAAKARLEEEQISEGILSKLSAPVAEFGEVLLGVVSKLNPGLDKLEALVPLIQTFKMLANKRSEERFEYLIDNISEDLQQNIDDLKGLEERTRKIEDQVKSPRFAELLSEAALQAIRATTTGKIQRLSHIAVSGAIRHPDDPIEDVLELERHAVELTDSDVVLLVHLDKYQAPRRKQKGAFREDAWTHDVATSWQEMMEREQYGGASSRSARSSLARLQARGFIIQVAGTTTINSPGTEPYAVLNDGIRFLQYLAGYKSEG
jgi:hypothetical protein